MLGRAVAQLTDRTASLSDVLGLDDREVERAVLSAEDDAAMVRAAEAHLAPTLPKQDASAKLARRIVERVTSDPTVTRASEITEWSGLSARELQRLFREYVGVTPKWVLRRVRLQEAAHRLASGEAVDLTRLAHDLGYFDQAHLTRDFRAVVGVPPSTYRAANLPVARRAKERAPCP